MSLPDLATLAELGQALIGVGLFAIAAYRCYLQQTGLRDLKKEFASYGLPGWCVHVVCLIEFSLAGIFTAGIALDILVLPTNVMLLAMMVVAIACRIKAREPWYKAVPALSFALVAAFDLGVCLFSEATCIGPEAGEEDSSHSKSILIALSVVADVIVVVVTFYEYALQEYYIRRMGYEETSDEPSRTNSLLEIAT